MFKGTILADQSVTLNTGASLEGRALARIAAVTLASNAITRPAPTTSILGQSLIGISQARMAVVNPWGRNVDIEFSVPSQGNATLRVFDNRGLEIAKLFDGRAEPGALIRVSIRTENLAPGTYFSKLGYQGGTVTKAIPLVY